MIGPRPVPATSGAPDIADALDAGCARRRIVAGYTAAGTPRSPSRGTAALACLRPATGWRGVCVIRPASAVALAEREAEELDDTPEDQPWRVVRMKEHPAEPMTVDDALFQMELVGHDFYLFLEKDSNRASVVYRRRGYDYGVLSLPVPRR